MTGVPGGPVDSAGFLIREPTPADVPALVRVHVERQVDAATPVLVELRMVR